MALVEEETLAIFCTRETMRTTWNEVEQVYSSVPKVKDTD